MTDQAPELLPNDRHYLSAIRKRLEQLYDASAENPRLREQLSDEVDWVDAQLTRPPSERPVATADWIKYVPDIVKNAMLTAWNYICDDTKCHPLDIEHGKGKFLTFEPKHWAQFAGEMAAKNIADLFASERPVAQMRETRQNFIKRLRAGPASTRDHVEWRKLANEAADALNHSPPHRGI